MAYDIFPKSEKELIDSTKAYPPEIRGELVLLYSYLKKTFPRVETPINLDATKKSNANVSRSIQADTTIDKIKREAKLSKLSIKFGNGSSGNRGVNNRGNNFETEFAYYLDQWWQGNNPSDFRVAQAINDLDKTYDLRKKPNLSINILGGENTKRPITFGTNIVLANPKGIGTDIGPSVTDITLGAGDQNIYLSLKLGATTTFFNVGVRTFIPPDDIKAYDIKGNGAKLLDLFGIDHKLFCDTFNGKLDASKVIRANPNQNDIETFLKSGIGSGYHIIHKFPTKILSKKMDEQTMAKAAKVGDPIIYYGGKGGKAKRVDIYMESPLYKFKLNFRDTQGRDGYPTRLMCDFAYK